MVLATRSKPPNTITHKKRSGQHHNISKHYVKTYWPYLPLFLILGVGLIANALWNQSGGVLGVSTDISNVSLLNYTDTQRTNNGESPLALNSKLSSAAQAKANDMAKRNYWSHNAPDGLTPWSFITEVGYSYQAAGENLAYGFTTSDGVITGWMNSVKHRDNILNNSFKDVGFGIADAANYQGSGPQTIVVAMYAEPVVISAASSPVTPSTVGITSPARNMPQPPAQSVARIQLLTAGNAPWSLFVISVLGTIAVLILFVRHGLFWYKTLARSETFIVHHVALDMLIVSVAVIGFVFCQTAGFIH